MLLELLESHAEQEAYQLVRLRKTTKIRERNFRQFFYDWK